MSVINRFRPVFACTVFLILLPCLAQSRFMHAADDKREDPFRGRVKFLEETPFVTKAVLRNGMTVIVNEHRIHPVVSIQMFVRAGILDEPPDSPGLARLLSSVVNRSEPDEAGGTLRKNVRMLGGLIENSTDYTHTRFEINMPSSQWKKALRAQFAAITDTSFDPGTIEIEERLLREEAIGRLDDTDVFMRESLLDLGFGSKIGKWSSIVRNDPIPVSLQKLNSFYRRMYVPERMMLVVSGDIRAGEVLDEAVSLYGDLKAIGGRGHAGSIEGSQKSFRYRGIEGNIPEPYLMFGYHAPAVNSVDYPAMEVLSAIVGLGEGSILSARLRDRKKIILDGKADLSTGLGFGYMTIRIRAAPEDIDRSEIAVLTELELLKRIAPTAVDMERAWAQLERTYRSQIETVSGRARMLARFESRGDWKQIDRRLAELRNIRAGDVQRVAAKYLSLENCSLLEYLPVKVESENRTMDSIRSTFEALLVPATDQEEILREKETVLAIEMPKNKDNFKFSAIQYPFKTASILRGPEIYIREDHTAPLIHMGLFFPGGRFAETENNAGITALMVRMMLQGSEQRSAYRFHRQLEVYGGQIQPVVADDYFGFYFSIISKNFEDGFSLLTESVKTPVLDRDTLERQQQLLQAERQLFRGLKKHVENSINPKLFRGFSYSRPALGTEKSIRGITLESIKEWYDRFVKNRKPVAVIVGDTEGTSLASYFVRHFSGSRFLKTEIPDEFPNPLEEKETIETAWDKSMSLVAVGFHAPPAGDVDCRAVDVLQSYFGNMGRLYQEIREKMGETYKIRVFYEPRLRGGSFLAYAVTNPGSEEEVLEALKREFRHIVENPIAYRDFRSAVNTAVGHLQIRRQSPLVQIKDVLRNAVAGEDIEAYRSYQTKLQSVYEEDLKDAAERILKTEKAVFLRIHGNEPLYANDSKTE
ncbi:MAG: insulinase family protein [Acidobacteria bacterium]|nr:insulinase family protein [Acidobacteriota bacterium]